MKRNELTELLLGREVTIRFVSISEAIELNRQAAAEACLREIAVEWGLPPESMTTHPQLDFEGVTTPRQVRAHVQAWLMSWARESRSTIH